MIPPLDPRLTLVFRVDVDEEREALHAFRDAFAGSTDIEAISEDLFAVHISPGICSCGVRKSEGEAA